MAQHIFLVHHAEATSPERDPSRPLTAHGREQAERVARAACDRGAKPAAIWHSGKTRARETADAWRRIVNPGAEFLAVPGITPDDDLDAIVAMIDGDERDIAVASHMPFLPMLLHRLTTGRRDRMSVWFPLNGCVALERGENNLWRAVWEVAP
jgi:phosphohistidine phosphatase